MIWKNVWNCFKASLLRKTLAESKNIGHRSCLTYSLWNLILVFLGQVGNGVFLNPKIMSPGSLLIDRGWDCCLDSAMCHWNGPLFGGDIPRSPVCWGFSLRKNITIPVRDISSWFVDCRLLQAIPHDKAWNEIMSLKRRGCFIRESKMFVLFDWGPCVSWGLGETGDSFDLKQPEQILRFNWLGHGSKSVDPQDLDIPMLYFDQCCGLFGTPILVWTIYPWNLTIEMLIPCLELKYEHVYLHYFYVWYLIFQPLSALIDLNRYDMYSYSLMVYVFWKNTFPFD